MGSDKTYLPPVVITPIGLFQTTVTSKGVSTAVLMPIPHVSTAGDPRDSVAVSGLTVTVKVGVGTETQRRISACVAISYCITVSLTIGRYCDCRLAGEWTLASRRAQRDFTCVVISQ